MALVDASVSDVSTLKESSAPQDIAEAVSKLAEKLVIAQTIVLNRDTSKSAKQRELEERLSHSVAEVEELKSTKMAMEKRAEAAKNSLRVARDEVAKLTVELEGQKGRVEELQQQLVEAEKRVTTSADTVHSEIQVLEEENIELMRENKELRVEVSRYKSSLSAGGIVPSQVPPATDVPELPPLKQQKSVSSPVSGLPEPGLADISNVVGVKRAFGRDIDVNRLQPTENLQPVSSVMKIAAAPTPLASSDGVENADGTIKNSGVGQRKTRTKAKALMSGSQGDENPAECTQS